MFFSETDLPMALCTLSILQKEKRVNIMSVNLYESPLEFLFWDLTAFKFHLHPVPVRNSVLGHKQKKSKTLIEFYTNALV